MFPHSCTTVTLIRAHSAWDTYARVLRVCCTHLLQQVVVMDYLKYTLQRSGKGQSCQIWWLTSPDTSIINHLTEAARTTHVQAWGLDKLVTLYLSRLPSPTSDRLPRHGRNSLNTGWNPFSIEQPLSPVKLAKSLGAYVLSRIDKSHVALRDTFHPPR